MYRFGRGIRFLSFTPAANRTNWDPTVSLELNHPTLVLLEKCSSRDHFKQILGQMMRTNLIGQTFPMSRLILSTSITNPENLDMAILLFTYFTPRPNLYIYNTMISALSFSTGQAFVVYNSMLRLCFWPDKHTLLYLLKAAKYIIENSLIKMYTENGQMGLAHKTFLCMPRPDVASFNIMIVGYAKKRYSLEAIKLFHEMVVSGFQPDEFTISVSRIVDSSQPFFSSPQSRGVAAPSHLLRWISTITHSPSPLLDDGKTSLAGFDSLA
ncbi:hypothetical protein Patl1_23297 [Pistacia atlantica]|uniref:Uncharacterized protein n=1 Tax=Pistacia atlantica TaxID=434234 RepID=A0ACC0ZXC0_9ROSI|nr:hypothetical protein Patl1_23297 [Pistacia atlantica]